MNTTPWGRKETLITPPRAPIYTYAAITVAVFVTLISAYLWPVVMWSRLERFYLPIYIESGVRGVVQKTHSYKLPTVIDAQHRTRPALPEDVEPGQTPQPDGRPLPIQLTAAARAEGLETITRGEKIAYRNKPLHAFLQKFVYGGRSVAALFVWPGLLGFLCLLVQLPFASTQRHRAPSGTEVRTAPEGTAIDVSERLQSRREGGRSGISDDRIPPSDAHPAPGRRPAYRDHGGHWRRQNPAHHAAPHADQGTRPFRHRLRPGLRVRAALL